MRTLLYDRVRLGRGAGEWPSQLSDFVYISGDGVTITDRALEFI